MIAIIKTIVPKCTAPESEIPTDLFPVYHDVANAKIIIYDFILFDMVIKLCSVSSKMQVR